MTKKKAEVRRIRNRETVATVPEVPSSPEMPPPPFHMIWQAGVHFGWLDTLKTVCGWSWVVTTRIEWPEGGEVAVGRQRAKHRFSVEELAPDWWVRLREWRAR